MYFVLAKLHKTLIKSKELYFALWSTWCYAEWGRTESNL